MVPIIAVPTAKRQPIVALGPQPCCNVRVTYLVFTQSEDGHVDLDKLARHAERFFGATLDLLSTTPATRDRPAALRLAFRSPSAGVDAAFALSIREAKREDHRAALDAESRGQAFGMAALAQQCGHLWELQGSEDDVRAVHLFCAVLASVALGPILPPDHSTLLGVRSARTLANTPTTSYRT